MRYKDKNGNVFAGIVEAAAEFCTGRLCGMCPMNDKQDYGCLCWAEAHPVKAARLMGLEVVDEPMGDTPTTLDDTPTVSGDTPTKEDNMEKLDKPRLAEVLGVEVGERICICYGAYTTRWFSLDDGNGLSDLPCKEILYAINHPESLIRAPRLTDAEIAIMRAVGAKWVSKEPDWRELASLVGQEAGRK